MARQERSGRHRWARRVGWMLLGIFIAVAVLGLGLMLSINSESGKDWLRGQLLSQGRQIFPGLRLEKIEGFLPFEVVLTNLQLNDREGDPALSVRQIVASPAIWPLLSRTIELKELLIKQPRLTVAKDDRGRWNLTQLIDPDAPELEELWDIVVRDLRLRDGEITVVPDETPTIQLSQATLRGGVALRDQRIFADIPEVSARYRASGVNGRLEAQLEAQVDSEDVRTRLEARAIPAEGEAIPILAVAEGPVDRLAARLLVGQQKQPLLSLSATFDLKRQAYELQAALHQLSTERLPLSPSLPPARINLRLEASGQGVPLTPGSRLQARLTSPGLTVAQQAIEELEVRASSQGAQWSLEQLAIVGAGIDARASGQGRELETFELEGQLAGEGSSSAQRQDQQLDLRGTATFTAKRQRGGPITLAAATDLQRFSFGELLLLGLDLELTGQLQPQLGRGTLTLRTPSPFQINGQRLQWLRAEMTADGKQLVMDARVAPAGAKRGRRLKPARLQATLPLEPGSFRLAPQGALQASFDWHDLQAQQLARLAGIEQPVGGKLSLWARATGTLAAPQVRGRFTLSAGRVAQLRGLAGRVELQATPKNTVANLRARLGRRPLLWGRLSASAGPQQLAQRWQVVPLKLQARLSPLDPQQLAALSPALAQLRGQIEGTMDLEGNLRRPQASLRASLRRRVNGKVRELKAALTARGQPGRTRLRGGVKTDGAQTLRFSAGANASPLKLAQVPLDHPRWRLQASILPTSLGALGSFFPPLRLVDGQLSGEIKLAGKLPHPRGQGQLRIHQLRANNRLLGDFQSTASLRPEQVTLQAALEQPQGRGALSFRIDQHGETRLSLEAAQLQLGPLRAVLAAGESLTEDRISAKVLAEATIQSPASTPLGHLLQPELITAQVGVEDVRLAINLNWGGETKEPSADPSLKPSKLDELLRRAPPFRLSRLEIKNSHLELVDFALDGNPRLKLAELALTLENVTSRRELAQGAPVVMTFRTVIEDSGETVGFATMDPLSPLPLFAGRVALRGLRLAALSDWLVPLLDVKMLEGTFSCFAVFQLHGEQLQGNIKPIIRSPKAEPAESASLLDRMLIQAGDFAMDLVTAGEDDAVATVVPIQGTLADPGVQLVPAILGVIRDTFVVGLASGFAKLPLEVAPEEESIFSQAAQALVGEDWLRAQPEE